MIRSSDGVGMGSSRAWDVGQRYLDWDYYTSPTLSDRQRARVLEAFAVEFENVSPIDEPSEGWGESMAYLCRRIAARLRGEPVAEWVPRWERVNRAREARDAGSEASSRRAS